jgi:micrococcal nuclease
LFLPFSLVYLFLIATCLTHAQATASIPLFLEDNSMKRYVRFILATMLLSLSLFFGLAIAQFQERKIIDPPTIFTGRVLRIVDSDTIAVIYAPKKGSPNQFRVRLAGIDAPKNDQAFGDKAKDAIAEKLLPKGRLAKEVKVEWKSKDKYERLLGIVYLDNKNLNKEMVETGIAWNLDTTDASLVKAEKEAKDGKKGLWIDAAPIPPSEFRNGKPILTTGELVNPKTIIFYLSQTGNKYHHKECQRIGNGKPIERTLDSVGIYGPCFYCTPPVLTTPEGKEDTKKEETKTEK